MVLVYCVKFKQFKYLCNYIYEKTRSTINNWSIEIFSNVLVNIPPYLCNFC